MVLSHIWWFEQKFKLSQNALKIFDFFHFITISFQTTVVMLYFIFLLLFSKPVSNYFKCFKLPFFQIILNCIKYPQMVFIPLQTVSNVSNCIKLPETSYFKLFQMVFKLLFQTVSNILKLSLNISTLIKLFQIFANYIQTI